MAIIGIVDILFAPLCFFLRNPPGQEEKVVSHMLQNNNSLLTHKYFFTLLHSPKPDEFEVFDGGWSVLWLVLPESFTTLEQPRG